MCCSTLKSLYADTVVHFSRLYTTRQASALDPRATHRYNAHVPTPSQRDERLFPRIYEVVKLVPSGQVTSYGNVATIVGQGCDARLVGYAMAGVKDDAVPWQRVINAQGKISLRPGRGADIQRKRLEAEGIEFDSRGRIDLDRYGWRGPDAEWAAKHGYQTLPSKDEPNQPNLL
jgi:methylated-DNA-protein-cysteine methyltransferase-like protein